MHRVTALGRTPTPTHNSPLGTCEPASRDEHSRSEIRRRTGGCWENRNRTTRARCSCIAHLSLHHVVLDLLPVTLVDGLEDVHSAASEEVHCRDALSDATALVGELRSRMRRSQSLRFGDVDVISVTPSVSLTCISLRGCECVLHEMYLRRDKIVGCTH